MTWAFLLHLVGDLSADWPERRSKALVISAEMRGLRYKMTTRPSI